MITESGITHSIDDCYLISNNNIIIEVSNGFLQLIDYSKDEIINKAVNDVFVKNLRILPEKLEKIDIMGKIDCYLFTKSLQVREVAISILNGKEINEKKYIILEYPNSRLEEKLGMAEKLILDNHIATAIYSAPDLVLLKMNQSYTDFFSDLIKNDKEQIGLRLMDFIPWWCGSRAENIFNELITTGKSLYLKEIDGIVTHNKNTFYNKNLLPIIENGKVKFIISMVENVTEKVLARKKFEEQSSEASKSQEAIKSHQELQLRTEKEKNEALKKAIEMKDEFLSIISHEFKTPLTVINSAIQAMELICKNELSDKAKGFLNKIRQNSNRQLKLVNNLLDITRINSGHLKINKKDLDIVLLSKSITESIRVFAEQKSIKLTFSSTLKKKVIGIDEENYERILLNLLSNAVKFTPKGKSVSVRVSQKIINQKCKVIIQVEDKGIGIPNDKKDIIFERFGQVDSSLTRQAEGTGIGLSLVKMLVEELGGKIELESEEGIGSIFTVIFPVTKVNETPIEQMLKEISDNRLIQATSIEFSDIY